MNPLNLRAGQKVSILKSNDLVPTLYKGIIKGFYYSNFAQCQQPHKLKLGGLCSNI
ncbi:hypothetical protein ACXAT3_002756 [Clostridium sporogenes]